MPKQSLRVNGMQLEFLGYNMQIRFENSEAGCWEQKALSRERNGCMGESWGGREAYPNEGV